MHGPSIRAAICPTGHGPRQLGRPGSAFLWPLRHRSRLLPLALARAPVDHLGLTPGDIALSVNDRRSFELIRNEGLRQGEPGDVISDCGRDTGGKKVIGEDDGRG